MSKHKKPSMRIWWIPQVPGQPFHQQVGSALEGKRMLNMLGRYDIFQVENNIKPDFCNAGGLEALEDGEWVEWYSEDGLSIDEMHEQEIIVMEKRQEEV